jgi:hypothetical protein
MLKDFRNLKGNLDHKIFCIGFNKTATTSLNYFLKKNGLPSQHQAGRWDIDKYQTFSDNGARLMYKKLADKYKDAIFILQVRNLNKWIKSRGKHLEYSIWHKNRKEKIDPPSEELYKKWILERQNFHREVLEFFSNNKSRLLIVDIDSKNWIQRLAKELNLDPIIVKLNKIDDSKASPEFLQKIDDEFNLACVSLLIPEKSRSESVLIPELGNYDYSLFNSIL